MDSSFDFSSFDEEMKYIDVEMRRHKGINKAYTKVGYTQASGKRAHRTKGGLGATKLTEQLTIVALAVIHQYGAGHIPPRPFMSQAFDNNLVEIEDMSANLYARYLNGDMTEKQSLAQLGEWYAGVIKDEILKGNFTPLAESTIRKKGSSKPLIDTGLNLLGGVDHEEVL